jgi:hypothetical protein
MQLPLPAKQWLSANGIRSADEQDTSTPVCDSSSGRISSGKHQQALVAALDDISS